MIIYLHDIKYIAYIDIELNFLGLVHTNRDRITFLLMQLFYLPVVLNPPRTSQSHGAMMAVPPARTASRVTSLLQQPFPISFELLVLASHGSWLLAIPKIILPSPHRTTRRPLTGHPSPSLTAPHFNPLTDSPLLPVSRLALTSPLHQHAHPFLD